MTSIVETSRLGSSLEISKVWIDQFKMSVELLKIFKNKARASTTSQALKDILMVQHKGVSRGVMYIK